MLNDNSQTLVLLIILNFIILASNVVFSNITHAQRIPELHEKSLDEITKYSPTEYPHIGVGNVPMGIGVNDYTIYVINQKDDTVSVIDGINNTKIGEDIKVGDGPAAIGINSFTNMIYVVNLYDNTVSVINGTTNTKIEPDIIVGTLPLNRGIDIDEATNRIYVTNGEFGTFGNVSIIDGEDNTKIGEDIKVGRSPTNLGINHHTNTIYVANFDDNNVSVINGTNNTRINDIQVGKGPITIAVNSETNTVYVANIMNNTVSVINGTTNTKIEPDIQVGKAPTGIGINYRTNSTYVANQEDGTVSVINGTTNTKIEPDIQVGKAPTGIGINHPTNTIYVANQEDGTVSVIDGKTNKVVAQVTFNIEPFNAGHIECDKDKLIAPLARLFYMDSNSLCIAKPNQGFEFVSWQENLPGNSTQLLKFTKPNNWISNVQNSILNFINLTSDKPEATLNITKFGSFTANFKALPPPLPPEYVATLFGVVATAFISSWLTPTIIGWRKAKNHQNKLNNYQNKLKDLHKDNKLDKNDFDKLDTLREKVVSGYTRGDITKDQYDVLLKNLSIKYNEIFKNEIKSLKIPVKNEDTIKLMNELDSKLDDVYLEEKIDKEHHTLLKDKIMELKKNKNSNK